LDELPLGRIHADAGKAAAQCVRTAVEHILAKRADALVTAPLHKEALSAAGESYPGHTELLQALTKAPAVRMMLANHELRVVLVTVHLALREAIAQITQARVLDTILMAHNCAVAWGFDKPPRIAVAGLNPHAGEGGLFGREEIDIIEPAIRAARAQGLQVTGPLAPDTVFMRARHTPQRAGEFDIVIAMYHDQGLIPVKYLGVAHGVNVTLGLPFIRTSPDHGTAFDIAGQGTADPTSLIAALKMAESLMSGIATS
jgi:4-hydroxythreonine-4-phosphate dehydrogenase